jgi:protein subunit release factor A
MRAVHRVQCAPEGSGRVHTSAVTGLLPEADDVEVQIMRRIANHPCSSDQGVREHDVPAVRITHLPTDWWLCQIVTDQEQGKAESFALLYDLVGGAAQALLGIANLK